MLRPLPPRLLLAAGSVISIAFVAFSAAIVAPVGLRFLLLLCAAVAVGAALQSALLDPMDLMTALLLSLPPVIALVAPGAPTWLIAPFGALLLLAGELNALGWECAPDGPLDAAQRRRLGASLQLAALGLVAALAVGFVPLGQVPGGAVVAVLAAAALAAFGGALFRRTR